MVMICVATTSGTGLTVSGKGAESTPEVTEAASDGVNVLRRLSSKFLTVTFREVTAVVVIVVAGLLLFKMAVTDKFEEGMEMTGTSVEAGRAITGTGGGGGWAGAEGG